MVNRQELVVQFGAANNKGWRVATLDFPASIDEPFFPNLGNVFRALEQFAPGEVRYLILGQDPYPTTDANGIAFAVDGGAREDPLPTSLRTIMRQVYPNGGGDPSLNEWITERKILLLNAALTVPAPGKGQAPTTAARGHLKLWHAFIKSIIVQLRQASPNVKLIAWGAPARELMCEAIETSGVFASCRHPSRPNKSFEQFWQTPPGADLRMQRL